MPATNLFLPATLKVTGPAIDRDQQMAYVKKAFARLERIGTHIVVFGSGGARLVPEGFPKDQAFQQLVEFGRRIAPEARARGITIAVEPLRTQETNIINSAAEGLALVNAIGDPNFQLMVDFYHLASVKEDPAIIVRASAITSGTSTWRTPKDACSRARRTSTTTRRSSRRFGQIGYDRRISVEASTKDLQTEAPLAIAFLRTQRSGRRSSAPRRLTAPATRCGNGEDARRNRPQVVHVLQPESLTVALGHRGHVRQPSAFRELIDRRVVDLDPDLVRAGAQQIGHVDPVRRRPDAAGAPIVDEHGRRLADRRRDERRKRIAAHRAARQCLALHGLTPAPKSSSTRAPGARKSAGTSTDRR